MMRASCSFSSGGGTEQCEALELRSELWDRRRYIAVAVNPQGYLATTPPLPESPDNEGLNKRMLRLSHVPVPLPGDLVWACGC